MHDEPKKTKQAVNVAVWDKNRLLILFRDKWLSEGTPWIMPGGGVEDGETTIRTAYRELHEEIGLSVPYEVFDLFKVYKTEWADELFVFELKHKFYSAAVSVQRDYAKFAGELWLPVDDKIFLKAIRSQLMPGLRMYLADKIGL